MKRILFTVIPEKGHINPYIGVAKHLIAKGYEIGFYSFHDISAQLEAAGLNCFIGEFSPKPLIDRNSGEIFAENVRNADWLQNWIKGLLIDNAYSSVSTIQQIIQQFKPDIVITDPMIYSAAIAATLENMTWIAISNSLNPVLKDTIESELLDTVQWLSPSRAELFKQYGMEIQCSGCDMISPYLNIAFTASELVGNPVLNVELVGPSIPEGFRGDESPFQWDKLSKDYPIVYMSLGSQIYHQPKMFKTIFEAVRDQSVQLVATVSDLLHTNTLGDIPSNVLLTEYTPQLQLLPKVSVMITHGGANSVMESIYYGVPMLITPICNDQFHQAYFIEEQNIGIHLNIDDATAEQCWNALSHLLTCSEISENIKRVSQSYQQDGALNAASLIENLLKQETLQ